MFGGVGGDGGDGRRGKISPGGLAGFIVVVVPGRDVESSETGAEEEALLDLPRLEVNFERIFFTFLRKVMVVRVGLWGGGRHAGGGGGLVSDAAVEEE